MRIDNVTIPLELLLLNELLMAGAIDYDLFDKAAEMIINESEKNLTYNN
jgi:hypothetical protein